MFMKKLYVSILVALLVLTGMMCQRYDVNAEGEDAIRILFSVNLNDHIHSTRKNVPVIDENGNEKMEVQIAGGYSYLDGIISQYRNDRSVLVDGGNFSTGTAYSLLYATHAPDLNMMGTMGYDAVTFGSNDFQFGIDQMSQMLNHAENSPQILVGNIQFNESESSQNLQDVFAQRGITPYTIVEKDGVKIGIFAVMDTKEAKQIRSESIGFSDEIQLSSAYVNELKEQGAEIIICLDHGSHELAKKVSGIDVLVTGNQAQPIKEPLREENTWIVASGSDGMYLGVLDLDRNTKEVLNYELVPVRQSDVFNAEMSDQAIAYWSNIQSVTSSSYRYNSVIGMSPFSFNDIENAGDYPADNNMADLITDAYVKQAGMSTGNMSFMIGIAARKDVGDPFTAGTLTIKELMEAGVNGAGYDGSVGTSLVEMNIKGRDLRDICEYDVTYLKDDPENQLYFSGMYYTWNENRKHLNYVEEVYVEEAIGYWVPVSNNKYYRVVMSKNVADVLENMEQDSKGFLKLTYYDDDNNVIEDISSAVLKRNEKEIKQWDALYTYLIASPRNENLVPTISNAYKTPRKNKREQSGFDLIRFFNNTSAYAFHRYKNILVTVIAVWAALKLSGVTIRWLRKRKENQKNSDEA